MRRKLVYCEKCGSDRLSCTAEFIVYHHMSFCSPDCRDDYQAADERREQQPTRRSAGKAA